MASADPEIRHLTIARRARYAVLAGVPGRIEQVWFGLHGYGQLAPRFLRYFRALAAPERHIVAPEGLHRHYLDHADRKVGASWMTSEDRLTDIDDYVAYLDRLYDTTLEDIGSDPAGVRVFALGFSQGVHTLCRWVARGRARLARAILWGATVPPDLDLDAAARALGRVDLRLVMGGSDEYFDRGDMDAQEKRLRDAGIGFRSHRYEGGHRLDADTLAELARD